MAWLFVLILALLCVIILAKWLLLKREVARIAGVIRTIHGHKSNERVSVSAQDPDIAALAAAVNLLYDDVYRERAEHARSTNEMKQSMANVSHDLRTPLTSIIGYLKLLREGKATAEQQAHYLAVAYKKSESLGALVGGLFTLAHLEAVAYPMELSRVDAKAVLSEELAGFYDALTASGQSPSIALSEEPLWVIGDAAVFSRVFQNLLQNMQKHGAEDVQIAAVLQGGDAVFTFANRAEALNEADVERLFQRFFTADRMRSSENTGLGLAIAKEFVEQSGGEINAALKDGILTFTIRWRAA